MNRAAMAALSAAFRSQFAQFDVNTRNATELVMKDVFEVRNLRSVQLWTRFGSAQRNFINPSISLRDFERRVAFAQALLETRTPNFPVKVKTFDNFLEGNAKKLSQYLDNDYTRSALTQITIAPESITFTYDAYGYGYVDDETEEGDLDEFLTA